MVPWQVYACRGQLTPKVFDIHIQCNEGQFIAVTEIIFSNTFNRFLPFIKPINQYNIK